MRGVLAVVFEEVTALVEAARRIHCRVRDNAGRLVTSGLQHLGQHYRPLLQLVGCPVHGTVYEWGEPCEQAGDRGMSPGRSRLRLFVYGGGSGELVDIRRRVTIIDIGADVIGAQAIDEVDNDVGRQM